MTYKQTIEGIVAKYSATMTEAINRAFKGDFTEVTLPDGNTLSEAITNATYDYVKQEKLQLLNRLIGEVKLPPQIKPEDWSPELDRIYLVIQNLIKEIE